MRVFVLAFICICGCLCMNCTAGYINVEAVLAKCFQRSPCVNIFYIYGCFMLAYICMYVWVPVYELCGGEYHCRGCACKIFSEQSLRYYLPYSYMFLCKIILCMYVRLVKLVWWGNLSVEAVFVKYFQRSLCVIISHIHKCFCVS